MSNFGRKIFQRRKSLRSSTVRHLHFLNRRRRSRLSIEKLKTLSPAPKLEPREESFEYRLRRESDRVCARETAGPIGGPSTDERAGWPAMQVNKTAQTKRKMRLRHLTMVRNSMVFARESESCLCYCVRGGMNGGCVTRAKYATWVSDSILQLI